MTAKQGLAFLTLLAFVASFLAARTFTTLFPGSVVVTGGVHFHHFWYGLLMVVAAGWLAIVLDRPGLGRILAIVFGLGAGLIGDEVGLLLTLGDYGSELTYVFFVGVISFAAIGFLFLRYREQIQKDVLSLGTGERVAQSGLFLAGLSALGWAFNQQGVAILILSSGGAVVALGFVLHRREPRKA